MARLAMIALVGATFALASTQANAQAFAFAFDNLLTDTDFLDGDEVTFQPVDGLTIGNVTFGFTIGGFSSNSADYNSGGPGVQTFTDDPLMIEGDAQGILQLDFFAPTSQLEFGFALSIVNPTPQLGATVTLFDAQLAQIGSPLEVLATSLVFFNEGLFTYLDANNQVGRAIIDFNEDAADSFNIIPVPAAMPLLLSGLVGLGLIGWRKRKAA